MHAYISMKSSLRIHASICLCLSLCLCLWSCVCVCVCVFDNYALRSHTPQTTYHMACSLSLYIHIYTFIYTYNIHTRYTSWATYHILPALYHMVITWCLAIQYTAHTQWCLCVCMSFSLYLFIYLSLYMYTWYGTINTCLMQYVLYVVTRSSIRIV